LTLLPAALLLAGWEWAASGNPKMQFLFASPSLVAHVAATELFTVAIWHHIAITFIEAALGLLAGTIFGTAAGLLLWGNGRINFITRPYILFISSIPIFALAPMTILWFGIGLVSKIFMAGFAVFFVSLLQAHEGAQATAKQYSSFARSIAAPTPRIITTIIIPGAIDWVMAGYKINVGSALVGAFIGEFVSSEAGLGHYILTASALYDVPRVLFGLLLISLLAITMTAIAWMLQSLRKI
jgi:NitT/TauT family transport system permease protein